jgi:lysine 6-dehydrogenase
MNILICGAGKMAQAIAFDLLHYSNPTTITLLDTNQNILHQVRTILKSPKIQTTLADITNINQIHPIFEAHDLIISAVPYEFNYILAKEAIQTKSHFIDLGGNNDIVAQERTLHKHAQNAGVTVIPDNGLAPGLVSVITHDIVNAFDTINTLNIRVGGIPQQPQPPFNYQLVFSLDGLINEYVEPALILDHGNIIQKPSLTELETIQFPPPYNKMEAFLTSGGCSTLPHTFKTKIDYLDYKTIRYPGHCTKIQLLFELGLASTQPLTINNTTVTPRNLLKELLKKIIPSSGKDTVLLQVKGSGTIKNQHQTRIYQIIDYYDTSNNITAMQRMTGFPVAITADMILSKKIIKTGVYCPEEIIPPKIMFNELQKRGITLNITT